MMERLRTLRVLGLSVVLWLAAAAQAQQAATAPDALVRDLTNDVLETIRADKTIQTGDVARVQKLVDEKILPYVDFQKMTQLAVGRGWRTGTAEQATPLAGDIRPLLCRRD